MTLEALEVRHETVRAAQAEWITRVGYNTDDVKCLRPADLAITGDLFSLHAHYYVEGPGKNDYRFRLGSSRKVLIRAMVEGETQDTWDPGVLNDENIPQQIWQWLANLSWHYRLPASDDRSDDYLTLLQRVADFVAEHAGAAPPS